MLTTPELIKEAALPYRLGRVLPRWLREVPLYQRTDPVPQVGREWMSLAELRRLPLITKEDIRRDFPRNFLRAGVELEALLDRELVELEHTSGTSEERTPLLLGRGWWAEQEERALRLNRFVASVLDEFPDARRVTINSPVCSGDICYSGVPSRADRAVGNALFVSLSRYPFLWGEAELARMAAEAVDWQAFCEELMGEMQRRLGAAQAAIAHLKLLLTAPSGCLAANLTSSDGRTVVHGSVRPESEALLTINARVQTGPTLLQHAVTESLVAASGNRISPRIKRLSCFAPAPPRPTHRFTEVVNQ